MRSYEELKQYINRVFSVNEETGFLYDQITELRSIFNAQLSSLNKINDLGFFEALTNRFWSALEIFLTLALKVTNKKEYDTLIKDSYAFIKSFDNALQGYLNTDRQFLEFPGHSMSLYDLPAKLGVAYTHFIDKIIEIFKDKEEVEVAYLLCPEPFYGRGVSVRRLLSGFSEDKDLLLIEIPYELMYDTKKLLFVISHEVAHYVGRSHRLFTYTPQNGNRNTMLKEVYSIEFPEAFDRCFLEAYTNLNHLTLDECTKIYHSMIYDMRQAFHDYSNNISIRELSDEKIRDISCSEVKDLLYKIYVNPQSRMLDRIVYRKISSKSINLFTEMEHEIQTSEDKKQFQKKVDDYNLRLLPRSIELTIKHIIKTHKSVFYVVKEGTADVLAIKLLNMQPDDYREIIDSEAEKIKDSIEETKEFNRKMFELRKAVVCKACFKKDFDQENSIITNESVEKIVKYLSAAYESFCVDSGNKVRTIYESDKIPNSLVDYMF